MSSPELSPEMWDEVRQTMATFPDDFSFVVTGSLVEGLGNANSDLDLYAIAEGNSYGHSPSIGLRQSHYVDCEHMNRAALDQLCDRVHACTWDTLDQLSLREIDRFYRVAIGIHARVTAAAVEETLVRFTKSQACSVFAMFANLRAYEHLTAASCALATGSHVEADMLTREAWLWSSAQRLAELGEGYPSLKWTGEKAARVFGRGSAEFNDLLDGYARPTGSITDRLDQLRSRVQVPAELGKALEGRSGRLADGVRLVGTDADTYLLRKDGFVIPVDGLVASVCRSLASEAGWSAATAAVADELLVPAVEVTTALWRDTEYLRVQAFVVPA